MVDSTPVLSLTQLSRLQVRHIELINAAGSIPLQLSTDIELGYPHYSEHKNVVTNYNCDSQMPVTLNPITEITGDSPDIRCNLLLNNWLTGRHHVAGLMAVFILCPLSCNTSSIRKTFDDIPELHIFYQPIDYLKAVDTWLNQAGTDAMCLLITVDSLIDYAEFSKQQSPLFHDLNPNGLIASEGLTAIICSVSPDINEPVLIADEPFYNKADTEITEALTQLFANSENLSPSLISNHGIDTNSNHEVYRAAQSPHLIQVRQSLGDSGLNELGLLIALAASRSQWCDQTSHGALWFYNQTRLLWPMIYSDNTDSANQGRADE